MSDITEQIEKLEEELESVKEERDELKEQLESVNEDDCTPTTSAVPFQIGKKYYIRTVTYHATGKVKRIKGGFLVLTDAAWIADSGRFREAIMNGVLSEVEPVEVEMYLNIASITDAFEWKHKLPREQK
jgi:hypothetical protein